jgi:16S rRNA (cytosine1402-N4)-methyltransferase
MESAAHKPVLLNEVMDFLRIKPDGFYVDATLGLGGHAEAILQRLGPKGRLLGLDVDPGNLEKAKSRLQPFEDRTITRRTNFRGLQEVLRELGWKGVDGMIFDLGISSPQLDNPDRGFSFQREGPLDMRLDPSSPITALTILKSLDERALAEQLIRFGEGRFARKLANRIVSETQKGALTMTTHLAKLCERVLGWRRGSHPATRVFLMLRSLVNKELESVSSIPQIAPLNLNPEGRLAVISFHSLEDKIIKDAFRNLAQDIHGDKIFRVVTKKPVIATEEESRTNPRSRSAKLRILERAS